LAELTGSTASASAELLELHLGVAWTLAMPRGVRAPGAARCAFARGSIPIAKVQLSSGLRIERVDAAMAQALEAYADDVYLHQVVERGRRPAHALLDLPDALSRFVLSRRAVARMALAFPCAGLLERMRSLGSTQRSLREIPGVAAQACADFAFGSRTYTWDVLPRKARRSR